MKPLAGERDSIKGCLLLVFSQSRSLSRVFESTRNVDVQRSIITITCKRQLQFIRRQIVFTA